MAVSLGIDQGLSGGLCWLNGLTDTDYKSVIKMPTRKNVTNRPDIQAVKTWLNQHVREYGIPSLVVVERSQAMTRPGEEGQDGGGSKGRQSARSLHTQGFNGGMLVGVFEFMGWPIEEPTPQQWKKSVLAGFKNKDKNAMIEVCRRRFPSLSLKSGPRARKDHDGMADAVGLALFGQYRIGNVPC